VANRVDAIDSVVLTHAHADHIMGMDDLRRFNAIRKGPLDVWSDERTSSTVMRCFGYAFAAPDPASKLFRPQLVRRKIEGPFEIGAMPWMPIPLFHGDMPILGFRVGNMAYCTDTNRIPAESYALLENLDVLVLDALTINRHETHFSLEEAVAETARIKSKQTFFTHIAHGIGHAAISQRLPPGVHLAYDGQRVIAGAD
jgi:phosphoribosyl 1,2-cyclic phosphate phosphodiesterase